MLPSSPPPGRRRARRRRKCLGPSLSSPLLLLQQLSMSILVLLLAFPSPANAQFGEIASVITSLLASGGGGAGLAGLAGTGAGLAGPAASGAGLAASAGSGAAGAAGSVGTLYQLAQAALQLTGTGVGIANQASESAWFPVVIESAAKMNKDFQDRLLMGGAGGGGGLGGLGERKGSGAHGSGKSTSGGIGTEYGKEFGSGEETAGGNGVENSLLGGLGGGQGGTDGSSNSIFSSRVSLLPNLLLPMPTLAPVPWGGPSAGQGIGQGIGQGRPALPAGLARLLPGETSGGNGQPPPEVVGTGQSITTAGKKLIGIGTVEEVPLSPPVLPNMPDAGGAVAGGTGIDIGGVDESEVSPALLPGEASDLTNPSLPSRPTANTIPNKLEANKIVSPKITVKLPAIDTDIGGEEAANIGQQGQTDEKKKGEKKTEATIEQIETEFSTDTEKTAEGEPEPEAAVGGGETVEAGEEEPLIPSSQQTSGGAGHPHDRLNMTHIDRIATESRGFTQMVPEYRKLIDQLKMGALTGPELDELQGQLAGNAEAGQPRENTEPPSSAAGGNERTSNVEAEKTASAAHRLGKNRHRAENSGSEPTADEQKRERASHRNLAALRRGLHSSESAAGSTDADVDDAESREEELVDGQQDPILRKIVDFNRPPVILSLERPAGVGRHHHHRVESGGGGDAVLEENNARRPHQLHLHQQLHQQHHHHHPPQRKSSPRIALSSKTLFADGASDAGAADAAGAASSVDDDEETMKKEEEEENTSSLASATARSSSTTSTNTLGSSSSSSLPTTSSTFTTSTTASTSSGSSSNLPGKSAKILPTISRQQQQQNPIRQPNSNNNGAQQRRRKKTQNNRKATNSAAALEPLKLVDAEATVDSSIQQMRRPIRPKVASTSTRSGPNTRDELRRPAAAAVQRGVPQQQQQQQQNFINNGQQNQNFFLQNQQQPPQAHNQPNSGPQQQQFPVQGWGQQQQAQQNGHQGQNGYQGQNEHGQNLNQGQWGGQQPHQQQQQFASSDWRWNNQPQQQSRWGGQQQQQPQQSQQNQWTVPQGQQGQQQQFLPWRRNLPDPVPSAASPGLVFHPFASGQLLTLGQQQQQQSAPSTAELFRFGRRR